jgi:hypothetical protein
MLRSALASISISLLAATATAGGSPPSPARVAELELELQLARSRSVYLRIDPARRTLEVRSRGLVLASVPLTGIEMVASRPIFATTSDELSPALPAVWTVTETCSSRHREVIAPEELRPYSNDDEDEPPAPRGTPGPRPTATPIPQPPVSYRATLDNGWDLWITDRLPGTSLVARFAEAVRDGWRRMLGRATELPPAVAVAMSVDDARAIHHIVQEGTKILVAAPE